MPKAFISVLLPFRNAAATIDAALAGLTARDDLALEVLAVDDGSLDGSADRVRQWSHRDPRVRLLRTARSGLVGALQSGLAQARGSLIARMDADDLTHPDRLDRQRLFLLANSDVALLGTCVTAFAEEGVLGQGMQHYVAWQNSLLTPEDHRRELFVESPLCHPSIMVRREALERAGGYRESAGPEDYELFMRLDQQGASMAKLPETLLSWRHRAGRATFTDPRYSLACMRAAKAPFLAARVTASPKRRRVIWGAGPTGKKLARELRAQGMALHAFVDIDPAKLGRTAQGCRIEPLSALRASEDFVVVAVGARGARDLIRPYLQGQGFVEGVDVLFAA